MTVIVNLRKMLHRKSAEYLNPNPAGNTTAGSFILGDASSFMPDNDSVVYVGGASAVWNYNADEDGWVQGPNSGVAGTFGAGACGVIRAAFAPGGASSSTATAGTTTTLTTSLAIVRSLANCKIRVISGTGIGYIGTIAKNTTGTNSIITVGTPSSVAFDNSTVFQIFSGSVWFFCPGAGTVGFSVYDRATNAWTARSVTNLPTTFGTDGRIISTAGISSNAGAGFVTGTATAGASTTITLGADKTFVLNQWTNFQVRITGGTGNGQIRSIASNTAGASPVVTVSSAWTTTPDSTSTYVIEGNDDYLYLMGNAAITLYRYSISSNTWSTLTPGTARAAAIGGGGSSTWVDNISDSTWTDGTYGTHFSGAAGTILKQNGRYIYSFRGGASNALDVYDIAANTWLSGVTYGGQMETFTTGSCAVDNDGKIYIQKEATGRIFRFDIVKNAIGPFGVNPIPTGNAVPGDKMFIQTFTEGATSIKFLYTLGNTRSELTRWLII